MSGTKAGMPGTGRLSGALAILLWVVTVAGCGESAEAGTEVQAYTASGVAGGARGILRGQQAAIQEQTWPREIEYGEGTLVLYQPQPERLEANVLGGRAAASYSTGDGDEPLFGTLWFTSRIDVDGDAGQGEVRDIAVTRARWPGSTAEAERRLTTYLSAQLANTVIPIDTDRLSASLASVERELSSLDDLRHEPPVLVFAEEVSELLLYDGEPRAMDIEGTNLEQIVNAAFAVVKKGKDYYLSGGKLWYRATDPMGPWAPIEAPPSDIAAIVPPDTSAAPAPSPPPAIITATEPTELVVTDGPPDWTPIGTGELIYVSNTETPIVREVTTNQVYVLISGRWFRATGFDGPWSFVRPDELPESFQQIPPASDLSGTRVSVAGTGEAEDAMLDAQVPQTAAIRRSEASVEVVYDGDPRFEPIDGTSVAYAVNTGAQVLRIDGRYYACDNAVWFESSSPTGPWAVADDIPAEQIQEIPPSAPVYNTTHVHVYDSTPDVVYVGYTPGYLWSFPYYGVPVYGTGWHYRPWWGPRYYYPRPPSYGLHVGYNPWTGWRFGFSWSVGFMNVGVSFGGGYGGYYRPGWGGGWGWHGGGGYYPPGGYRPPIFINTGDINIGNRVNIGNQINIGDREGIAQAIRDRAGVTTLEGAGNLYNRAETRDRLADAGMLEKANKLRADRVARDRPNDVFADRDGNLFQHQPGGQAGGNWNSREEGQWKPTRPETLPGNVQRPAARPEARPAERPQARPAETPQARPAMPPARPQTRPVTAQRPVPAAVQRDQFARTRGATRATSRPATIRRPTGRRG